MTIEYQNFSKNNLYQRSGSAVLEGTIYNSDVFHMWINLAQNRATVLQYSFNGTCTLICKWNVKIKKKHNASI